MKTCKKEMRENIKYFLKPSGEYLYETVRRNVSRSSGEVL